MTKTFRTLAFAAAATALAGAGSAATLMVSGGDPLAFGTDHYSSDCSGGKTTCYDPNGSAGSIHENISTYFDAASYPGLTLEGGGTAQLKVEFLGKEAGDTNIVYTTIGGGSLDNHTLGASYTFTQTAGGDTVDLSFLDPGRGSKAGYKGFGGGGAIAFSQVFDGRYVYAYFDDSGASRDRDWDDMVVKISIVPVPAAGLLMLGGLGSLAGFGALRRRKKATA